MLPSKVMPDLDWQHLWRKHRLYTEMVMYGGLSICNFVTNTNKRCNEDYGKGQIFLFQSSRDNFSAQEKQKLLHHIGKLIVDDIE